MMTNSYSDRHPEIDVDTFPETDRIVKRQLALVEFRRLKLLKRSELTFDEKLFMDNFEAAMLLWWRLKI
jgi:hypothetical protein